MARIGQHPATAIVRGINELVRIGGSDRQIPIVIVEEIRTTEWASITFTGLRHEFDLRFEGERDSIAATIIGLADGLGDTEIAMSGHFVAEVAVAAVMSGTATATGTCAPWSQRLRVEALTIRD